MSSFFMNCLCLCKTNSHGEQEGEIVIGGHPHPFSYHEQKRRGSTYQCNGCQQTGFGPYYSCNDDGCNFHYHKLCGDILRLHSPPVSNHHPYPVGRYVFTERAPSRVRYCIACGDQVRGAQIPVEGTSCWCSRNRSVASAPYAGARPMDGLTIVPGGNYCYHVGCVKSRIIQSWQNGGNNSEVTIRLEIQLPQIRELAAAAIRLIIGALFGLPNVADIFTVLFS
ncbi:hypothetical protein NL676_037147 [Syzygium grande]|nr:hypothetical protein NL676_037147 [Syzygium grande]